MAIFKALDDPRISGAGINDDDLIRYLIAISGGVSRKDAFARLLVGKNCSADDGEYIRGVVEQFPVVI